MAIEKTESVKEVTVYTTYVLAVKTDKSIVDNGVAIHTESEVRNIQPTDDVSGETGLVKDIADKLFTDEVKAAYAAAQAAAAPAAEESSEEESSE